MRSMLGAVPKKRLAPGTRLVRAGALPFALGAVARWASRDPKNPAVVVCAPSPFPGIFLSAAPFPIATRPAALTGFAGNAAGFPAFRPPPALPARGGTNEAPAA